MAVRLRMRQVEEALLGGRGAPAAVGAWAGVVLALSAAFLVGNVLVPAFLIVFAVVVVAMSRTGTPSHWSHWLMVVSLVTGAASAGFVWWVAGAMIDAADNFTPEPALTSWGGPALILFVLSFLGLVVSAVMGALTRRE